MTCLRNTLGLIAVSAALGLSAPALASEPGPQVPLKEIYGAYRAICVANAGDGKAQTAAAEAAPYRFEFSGTSDDGTNSFENGRLSLRISQDEGRSFCMVLGDVATSTTLTQGVATAQPQLGKPEMMEDGDEGQQTALWSGKIGSRQAVYIYIQMTQDERTVSGFMLGVE